MTNINLAGFPNIGPVELRANKHRKTLQNYRTMDQEDGGETDKQVELLNPNLTDEEEENDYEEIDDEKLDNLEAVAEGSSKDNNEGTTSNEGEVNESDEEDDEDDDDDDDDVALKVEGCYDPSEFENLEVDAETRSLFSVIMKYTPQTVELDHKFRPFIPDFIPAVGDIDAFIRSTRPDNKDEVRNNLKEKYFLQNCLGCC